MWLEDIANYIRSANIDGIGSKVFIYTMKATDTGAMITSHNTGLPVNNDIPDYYKGPFQLIVRANDPRSANAQATAIWNLLNSHEKEKLGQGVTFELPSIFVNFIYPRHLPVVYPRSDGDFFEASVNFDICFVAISA